MYHRYLSIDKAERMQDAYEVQFSALKKYKPKNFDYLTARKNLLNNAKKFFDGREIIINTFKNKIFPLRPEGFPEYEGEGEDRFYRRISTNT